MKKFLLQFFTWWNGVTLNTRLYTWRKGEEVGKDEFGNTYYQTIGGKIDPTIGVCRRWVIFNGVTEASAVPAGWNGWLHQTVDVPPSKEDYKPKDWQLPHLPNQTGTPQAYRPQGSLSRSGKHAPATGDYQPWTPGN